MLPRVARPFASVRGVLAKGGAVSRGVRVVALGGSHVLAWQRVGTIGAMAGRPVALDFRRNGGIRSLSSLPSHTPLSMPALSPTMTQGNIAKWMIKVGQKIAPGDQLCDLETDKATIAWEAQDEGYVAAILAAEGTADIPVGQVVLVICDNEADVPAFASYKAAAAPAAPAKAAPAPSPPAAATASAPSPTPATAPKPAAPAAAVKPATGGSFLEQVRRKQWVFSKQFGLPTPQHNYN